MKKAIVLFTAGAMLLIGGCGQKPDPASSASAAGSAAPAASAAAAASSAGSSSKSASTAPQQTARSGPAGLTEISFKQFFTPSDNGTGQVTEWMKQLNGKKVGIKGYMTELTPIDDRFIYLVPQAGSLCPFCSADNPQYLEAIAVYIPKGDKFQFTKEMVWAFGTLEVGEQIDERTGLISMFRLKAETLETYQAR
ncbi:hypothetical protein ACFFK0_13360 [Paenibacillus chartarius]|uniref:DUF3299 domain-containing protein n=1 Tax=Paenibacillus chartarius TaxID=747481 RepID=A0ABV6DLA3_9BACL